MQTLDWNDLRYVAAVARAGSYAAAARVLKLDGTTVARRLRALESALGVRLFDRSGVEGVRLTQAGEIVVKRADAVESQIGALESAVKGADSVAAGTVRLTAVPILINRILVPSAIALMRRHPNLRLEMIGEFRNFSLSRREADIALRLSRPSLESGSRILAKRIGTMRYAPYVASSRKDANELPWLHYDEDMSHLPQARWVEKAAARGGGLAGLAVNDAETILQGVRSGIGRGLLPCLIADAIAGIERDLSAEPPFPEREVWLLSHPDLRHLGRMDATLNWLEEIFATWDFSLTRR